MDELLVPRDLRKEECKPVPDEPARRMIWVQYCTRWKEAKKYAPEEYAFLRLTVEKPTTSTGHLLWLPVSNPSDEEIAEVVEIAKGDRDAHEFLRAWLAGEMEERASLRSIPTALTPFVKRLAAGYKPDNRGKGKAATKRNTKLRVVAEAIGARYGLPLYRSDGNLEGTTCPLISRAITRLENEPFAPEQVYEVLRKGG
jgi:hypothetical protein